MKINNKKGFTLIELLVVIAIIGILATGGIGIYTSQMQKARDTTRLQSRDNLRTAIEQFYQEKYSYPVGDEFKKATGKTTVGDFMQALPEDPKSKELCNKTGSAGNNPACEIAYAVGEDTNKTPKGAYELSVAFENSSNIDKKAKNSVDQGNDDFRDEFNTGNPLLKTNVAQVNNEGTQAAATNLIVIIRKNGAIQATVR